MTIDYICRQFPDYSEKEVELAYNACVALFGNGHWKFMYYGNQIDCIWMYLEGRKSKNEKS